MKASALREMTLAELAKKLDETQRELWAQRLKVSQQRKVAKIRGLRRDIARIKQVMAAHGPAGWR
ncbi:MAG: 50S ribosomal protein L29 [Armatimonadota bacterium]|nr:50S ribosomal protein L29 [Armatimonadota bacterium]